MKCIECDKRKRTSLENKGICTYFSQPSYVPISLSSSSANTLRIWFDSFRFPRRGTRHRLLLTSSLSSERMTARHPRVFAACVDRVDR